jgi:hypothetical protein
MRGSSGVAIYEFCLEVEACVKFVCDFAASTIGDLFHIDLSVIRRDSPWLRWQQH